MNGAVHYINAPKPPWPFTPERMEQQRNPPLPPPPESNVVPRPLRKRHLLAVMAAQRKRLNTHQLAEASGLSYLAVGAHLRNLHREGRVERSGNLGDHSIVWAATPKGIKEIQQGVNI